MCWLIFWKGTLQIKIPAKKNLMTPAAAMSAGQADFIQFLQQFLKYVTATWIDDTWWYNQNKASNGSLKPGFENISEARGDIRHHGGAGSKGKPITCRSSEIHLKTNRPASFETTFPDGPMVFGICRLAFAEARDSIETNYSFFWAPSTSYIVAAMSWFYFHLKYSSPLFCKQ